MVDATCPQVVIHDDRHRHDDRRDTVEAVNIGRAAAAAESMVTGSLMTAKDADQNITTQVQALSAQTANNFTLTNKHLSDVQQNLGESSRDLADIIHQTEATQTQVLTQQFAESREAVRGVDRSVVNGFSAQALAECKTQHLVDSTSCEVKTLVQEKAYQLSKELAECCCENRLAIEQTKNLIENKTAFLSHQLDKQTCELKERIATDGAETRELINANRQADLLSENNDLKAAVREAGLLDKLLSKLIK